MRIAAIVVWWLLLAAPAPAVVQVVPLVPVKCSHHVRIRSLLDGKPVSSVSVNLYGGETNSSPAIYSALTKEDGVIALPALGAGTYRVEAIFHARGLAFTEQVKTAIWLEVVSDTGWINVPIDLTKALSDAREFETEFSNRLDEAERGPNASLRLLHGTVEDLTGAHVPAASIAIFDAGPNGWSELLKTASDANGTFSLPQLSQGRHVAVFSASGFRDAMVPFAITDNASGGLQIKLKIGFTDVSVPSDSSRIATTDNWQLTTDN